MNIRELTAQEGDKKQFMYKSHDCLIKRNGFGCLCGYVCIDSTNLPLDCINNVYDNINVHGGLTFGGFIDCKKYLGFDCAHLGDLIPKAPYFDKGVYRDMDYVENEIKSLVDQILDLEKLCK